MMSVDVPLEATVGLDMTFLDVLGLGLNELNVINTFMTLNL